MTTLTKEEIAVFVGPSAGYYAAKWSPPDNAKKPRTGFNAAAFLFSGFWLLYRKICKVALIFFGIILFEFILEEVIFERVLGKEIPRGLDLVVCLATGMICGGYGNRWYLSHAAKVITQVRSEGLPEKAMMDKLSRRGGTSVFAALGIFVLFLAVIFAVLLCVELLLQK